MAKSACNKMKTVLPRKFDLNLRDKLVGRFHPFTGHEGP